MAGPLNLVQGGLAIIGRTPIFTGKKESGSDDVSGEYFGLLSVVINLPSLLEAAGLEKKDSQLAISIRGKDGLGSQGEFFYGSESIFKDNPVSMEVTLPGGHWQMAATPVNGWQIKSPRVNYYRLSAMAVGFIIFSLLFIQHNEVVRRKAVEKAIAEKEKFLSSLLSAIPVPVFYKDRAGIYQGFNDAYETFFGKPKDQLIGKSVFDINPKELAQIYHAKDTKLFESGGVQHYESKVKNAKNKVRDVIFDKSVYTDNQDKVLGLIGTILDITDRKQMEKALRQSEERFREMADLLPGAIVEIDVNFNVTYVNQQGLKLFHYNDEDYKKGLNGLDFIHPEDKERALNRVAQRSTQKTLPPTEYRMITKDGQTCWVFFNASAIYKADKIIGFRMVLTDIRERKKIEKEREKLIDELQNALAEIKTLRGIVPICSHCKKIRDDEGYWNILESYIQKHSEASFSHSLCPDCSDKLYGKEDWYKKMKEKGSPPDY
ncbi:MAG: PAS domain S-box protein [Desulfobacter sp.]|nr:PAS domain S-box protein [Desulfobacter sp.]